MERAVVDGVLAKECVGCGFCCIQTPCDVARRVHGPVKKCPSLYWDTTENKHRCKLMKLDGDLGARYREELYAGAGCCSGLNSWRNNVINRIEPEQKNEIPFDKYFQHFIAALGKQWITGDTIMLTIYQYKSSLIEKLGISEEDAVIHCNKILGLCAEQRSSFSNSFMGGIEKENMS